MATQWEYENYWYTMRADVGSKKWIDQLEVVDQRLNQYGAEGWELVNVSTGFNGGFDRPNTWMLFAVFKRPRR